MYLCLQCSKALCRFCIHEEEIVEYFCRHCPDPVNSYDAQNQNNNCMRHLQCPICFQVLIISLVAHRDKKIFYYVCPFCKWDAMSFNYHSWEINNLLAKVQFYKGLYMTSP